ncbi:TPA: methylhydantoinase, partial [Candidatus Latescibacteria bacterium]|nr:methylhydantoinase [Candidatus Latescibacterota bacterium]
MAFALGIDIGGTFTDIVVVDAFTGAFEVVKTLTTYPDPSEGVLDGLSELFTRPGMSAQDVTRVIHGTTLVTNTLIERKGAKTALVTTQGFCDALEIGREGRYDIYDLRMQLPEPLVERRYRFEVDERLNPDGSVRSSLNTPSVVAVCDQLRDAGVESVGVCLLHAYANPEHETILRDAIADHLPGCPVTLSSEVAPELGEFERSSTTVANAYVQPLVERYLRSLGDGLANTGVCAPLHVMLSNGGTCSVETAEAFPVRLVESGPCGGALAAAEWGRKAGLDRVLAFDMGGTTAKAVLTIEGTFPVTTESEVARVYRFKRGSGLPLLVPVLDMIEIGAGGGSIAHVNALGLPAVGPESAGSSPGPACYDRGGDRPTVTDADLLLGYLNPDYFLGGSMSLSVDRAWTALSSVADQFGGDALGAAHGIHQLVNENMASAARVHAAERGVDLRSFALVATGGAGPVHACGVASRLGIDRVLVPPIAGVGSAFGLLLAPISFDFARSYVCRVEDLNIQRLRSLLDEMMTSGREVVIGAGVADADVAFEIAADIR